MSQTILQAGSAENIRKAANNAALLKVVSDLVAAKRVSIMVAKGWEGRVTFTSMQ